MAWTASVELTVVTGIVWNRPQCQPFQLSQVKVQQICILKKGFWIRHMYLVKVDLFWEDLVLDMKSSKIDRALWFFVLVLYTIELLQSSSHWHIRNQKESDEEFCCHLLFFDENSWSFPMTSRILIICLHIRMYTSTYVPLNMSYLSKYLHT